VIGEDLGTVPAGFREMMDARRMYGCGVLYFEQEPNGDFRSPTSYRPHTLVSVGTHDLPTAEGWWNEADLDLRARLEMSTEEGMAGDRRRRKTSRAKLIEALGRAGLLQGSESQGMMPELLSAIHAYLAGSSALLFALQLDDLFKESDPLNVPGTVDQYPNWRRKLSRSLGEPAFERALAEIAAICSERGRGQS
jgi:4-alpha-glucanotransferase